LATPSQVTHDKKNDPVKMIVPNFWLITKEDGTLLFILRKAEDEKLFHNYILTTHEAIDMKLQWVTPQVDGFREVLWINQDERVNTSEKADSQLDRFAEGVNRARDTPAGRIVERSVTSAGKKVIIETGLGILFGGPVAATFAGAKSFLVGVVFNSLRKVPEIRKWELKILSEMENVQNFLKEWDEEIYDE
jgi:hypothetical protein